MERRPGRGGGLDPGKWVIGGLLNNQWSFAGDSDRADVNQMLFQPFVNYNLDDGWYLTSAPIITANWEARRQGLWTVPVGGGVGRLFRLGQLPINAQHPGLRQCRDARSSAPTGRSGSRFVPVPEMIPAVESPDGRPALGLTVGTDPSRVTEAGMRRGAGQRVP